MAEIKNNRITPLMPAERKLFTLGNGWTINQCLNGGNAFYELRSKPEGEYGLVKVLHQSERGYFTGMPEPACVGKNKSVGERTLYAPAIDTDLVIAAETLNSKFTDGDIDPSVRIIEYGQSMNASNLLIFNEYGSIKFNKRLFEEFFKIREVSDAELIVGHDGYSLIKMNCCQGKEHQSILLDSFYGPLRFGCKKIEQNMDATKGEYLEISYIGRDNSERIYFNDSLAVNGVIGVAHEHAVKNAQQSLERYYHDKKLINR
ncbi:MAG: hypothetical protein FWC61_03850 [Proteobacteria bacterium]|nr:hypothetical protein [Pseudomonadota bacterium]